MRVFQPISNQLTYSPNNKKAPIKDGSGFKLSRIPEGIARMQDEVRTNLFTNHFKDIHVDNNTKS